MDNFFSTNTSQENNSLNSQYDNLKDNYEKIFIEAAESIRREINQFKPDDSVCKKCTVKDCKIEKKEENEEFHKTCFLFIRENDDKLIGMLNIRICEDLKDYPYGHIGYSIRPLERNKGYGKIQFFLALEELKKNNIKTCQMNCESCNDASRKVILSLGGVFEKNIDCEEYYLIDIYKAIKENAYGREEEIYQCEDCSGCPYAEKCKKGEGNRTVRVNQELTKMHQEVIQNLESIQGALLRMNRSIQAEGTFGIIKNDERPFQVLCKR